jgi:hypothetical protein
MKLDMLSSTPAVVPSSRRPEFRLIRIQSLLFAVSALLIAATVNLSGKWTATFSSDIGQQNYTFDFRVDGSRLTGTAKSTAGESQIQDGQVTKDTIVFVENLSYNGNAIRMEYTGKIISPNEIAFTRKVGNYGTEQFTARRQR